MKKLHLFAASKDQLRYFSELVKKVHLPIEFTFYKSLKKIDWHSKIPQSELNEKVEILVRRKKNASSGYNKSAIYWWFFRLVNRARANLMFRQYQAWLKSLDADIIGVWNGKKFRQAVLILAAKKQNKEVIYFERGPLPGYSVVDPQGVNAHSSIPRDANFYRTRKLTIKPEHNELDEKKTVIQYGLPKDYIFVPFQVVEDSNVYLHSPWIKNMRQLYWVLETFIETNPSLHFVIKPHPACPERYDDLVERASSHIHFVKNIDSQALVQNAQAVLTINSTVGIEALMAHKKLIVMGETLYGFSPLVKVVHQQDALDQALKDLETWSLDDELIEQFLDYLKQDYAIPGDAMYSANAEHWKVLEQKLALILQGKPNQAIGLTREG